MTNVLLSVWIVSSEFPPTDIILGALLLWKRLFQIFNFWLLEWIIAALPSFVTNAWFLKILLKTRKFPNIFEIIRIRKSRSDYHNNLTKAYSVSNINIKKRFRSLLTEWKLYYSCQGNLKYFFEN